MLNLWGLEGPLAPPLDGNLGFSEFSLRFGGRPYPHEKLQVPRTPRNAQTFMSSVTYNRLYSILTRASRFEGEASPPQGPMRDMSRAQYFRSASHFGRLRAQYCRSASHFGSF